MIEKLKRIHYMFYASLVFMGFPFISILLGEVPYWHFFLALLFIASYLEILMTENKKLTWVCWFYLLAYVAGNTLYINPNYFWFYFFISNLLVYHFEIRNLRSPYLWTVFLSQFLLFGIIFFKQSAMEYEWVFLIIIFFLYPCHDLRHGPDSNDGGVESSTMPSKTPRSISCWQKTNAIGLAAIYMTAWATPLPCSVSRQI